MTANKNALFWSHDSGNEWYKLGLLDSVLKALSYHVQVPVLQEKTR
jgi:hypothetical protein